MRISLILVVMAVSLFGQDPQHPQELVGVWERSLPALKLDARYLLAPDGSVTGGLGGGAGVIEIQGTWKVEGTRLVVATSAADFAGDYKIAGDILSVAGVGELRRIEKKEEPASLEQLSAEARMLGVWERVEDGARSIHIFRRGGHFTHLVTKGGKEKVEDGKWSLGEQFLELTKGEFVPKTFTLPRPTYPDSSTMIFNDKPYKRLSGGSVEPVEPSPKLLVGYWWDRDQSGEVSYRFNSTGRFREIIQLSDGGRADVVGPFKLEGEAITFVNESNEKSKRCRLHLLDRDTLVFELGEDVRVMVHRLSSEDTEIPPLGPVVTDCEEPAPGPGPEPVPVPGPVKSGGVAGVWVVKQPGISAVVTFAPDGRFAREWTEEGETSRANGTWAEKGTIIEVMDSEEGRLQLPFKLLGPDVLQLTIEGEDVRFRRQGAKLTLPKELVGVWAVADETGSVRLELRADATFQLDLSDTQQRHRLAGSAMHSPGRLDLEDTASGRTLEVPYKLEGSTLKVELGETMLALQKQ